MNDEQIKQRIAYLVQHGGLYEDPIAEIRTELRRLRWMVGGGSFGLGVVALVLLLLG
jgi:hypothetical protein